MLYKLWYGLRFLLPYGLILLIYRYKKSLPVNLKTKSGEGFKAVLLSKDYGILISANNYIPNRAKVLKEREALLKEANEQLIKDVNELSFDLKEEYFGSKR